MQCRACGACCIALSISSLGKPGGVRCDHLTKDNKCALYGKPERPKVCSSYNPDAIYCGKNFNDAMLSYGILETLTDPKRK